MLEERIVHLPELPLRPGRLGRFGSVRRVRMHLAEGEVAKHEPHTRAECPLNGLHDRVGLAAVRTFVIPILDERDWRSRRALRVIAIADRQHESGAMMSALHVLLTSC